MNERDRKKKEKWKGMSAVLWLGTIYFGDMIIELAITTYIKPEEVFISRKGAMFLGEPVDIEVTSYMDFKKIRMSNKNKKAIYTLKELSVGGECSEFLQGKKKELIYRVDREATLYDAILKKADQYPEREDMKEVERELRRRNIPETERKKHISFIHNCFNLGRVKNKR